jgi:vancomycin resistance protein YoaR
MTEPTFDPAPAPASRRPRVLARFAIAFLVGILAALALGVGALYAYDQQYAGKVLPGVRVGSIDLAGLGRDEAIARVRDAYAGVGQGEIRIQTPGGVRTISFEQIDRRVNAEAVVDAALGVGRTGGPVERVIADARTALRGVTLDPMVTYDAEALSTAVAALAARENRDPTDAKVERTDVGFVMTPGVDGLATDPNAATAELITMLGALDAPNVVEVALPTSPVAPAITTAEAAAAKAAADRLTAPVKLSRGDRSWDIPSATLRSWTTVGIREDGTYGPLMDSADLPRVVRAISTELDRAPRNATFTTRGAKITGVKESRDGYAMDRKATNRQIRELFAERIRGSSAAVVEPTVTVAKPALTTAQADAVIPKMRKVSTWTTYFPIGIKNAFGANIWIPAMDLNGHVVAPGEEFDFWASIGPVTRERGYRDGGAIINGRTEPQGALAGGICSTSTTLFNAALRAGYEMGDRRNHYYYIDRYPLGLDATVFKSDSSVQTMSFTNDTRYPILIRAYKIRDGNAGYVRFELWSVPTGRKVSLSKPIVKNVRPATDTVEYTSSLEPGVAERVEYPVDGKQVWVTRTVRDKSGAVIHRDEYYSNYARITGVTRIGRAADAAPSN